MQTDEHRKPKFPRFSGGILVAIWVACGAAPPSDSSAGGEDAVAAAGGDQGAGAAGGELGAGGEAGRAPGEAMPDADPGPAVGRDGGAADTRNGIPADAGTSPILFKDEFETSRFLLNTSGVGGGWFGFPIHDQIVEVSGDSFNVTLAEEHSSYGLANANKNWKFDFWNPQGVTAEWVIKDTTVVTRHQFGNYLAFIWQFGIISGDKTDRRVFNYWQGSRFKEGGLWFSVGRKDASDAAQFWVTATNKTVAISDAEIHAGDPGYEEVVRFAFKIKYPMTVRLHMDAQGWRFELPGQAIGNQKTSYNWGSDMKRAPITTEFQRGAFLLIHPRVAGLTAAGTSAANNSGKLERVTVVKPGNR